jgi:hypothetical protein
MRDLYDRLISGGEAEIEQLLADRQQEGIALEFKAKADPSTGQPNRDDRRNLGVTLSALSNSMGGVLVWGVQAARDADGVDCATGLVPITGIERFKAEITRLVSQAIMPRHEGIFVEAVRSQRIQDQGYLVLYVERSERRPHRCEIGEKQYFKRVGDSSVAMEHYDIEDSFKRQVVPTLEVNWIIRPSGSRGGPDGYFQNIFIEGHLHNPSPLTARFPYLTVVRVSGGAFVVHNPLFGQLRVDPNGEFHFSGGPGDVIHPGLSLPMARVQMPEVRVNTLGGDQVRVNRSALQPVRIAFRYGCYNSRQSEAESTLSAEQIVEHGIPGGYIYCD